MFKAGAVYSYSDDDISKSTAIVQNVQKDRIPEANIIASLLKALVLYPYNRSIYVLLLQHGGGDQGRLDAAVSYFGLASLDEEKKRLFDAKRNGVDLSTLAALNANLPALKQYAQDIGMTAFEEEAKVLHEDAAEKAFAARIEALDLNTVADFRSHLLALRDYAKEINYLGYKENLAAASEAVKLKDFKKQAASYPLATPADCDQNLPVLAEYARKIGFEDFLTWAADVRKLAEKKSASKQKVPAKPRISPDRAAAKPKEIVIGVAVIGLLLVLGYQTISYFSTGEQPAASVADYRPTYNTGSQPAPSSTTVAQNTASVQSATPAQSTARPFAPVAATGSNRVQRPLSNAALQAISEGFVDIKDPEVQACTDAKVAHFRVMAGEEALLRFDMYNEFAVECGFNI
ncbi:hypothetical protein FXN63_08745 [Pigmentiphaga aceris]|uniref:Uncharacterized protein n=1 Tax=Pigmentiphaga aceris TaxID=1940612 RepID=A0A5C0AZA6_9BURK|nr:hypothetical protein FXN63_08745 [Pigmentiphaga aceris]